MEMHSWWRREDAAEARRRYLNIAGPAAEAGIEVPVSLLSDPLLEPHRYAEIVRPHWDRAADLVERDYSGALAMLGRLREEHLERAEREEAQIWRSKKDWTYFRSVVQEEARHFDPNATLFDSLGLAPLASLDERVGFEKLLRWPPLREEELYVSDDSRPFKFYWVAEVVNLPPSVPVATVRTLEPDYLSYSLAQFRQEGPLGEHTPRAVGDWTWARTLNRIDAVLEAPKSADLTSDEVRLRIAILAKVISSYEIDVEVSRYDTAAAKANPPEVPHAFKLAEDADYCVERACTLIRTEGLTLRAAHARLVEEVRGEYPEKSPFFPHYERLKDAFKTRGIKVRDLKGENGGSGGPELSA